MHVLNKVVEYTTAAAAKVAQITLTFTMLVIVANVVSRRVWRSPVPGTVELVEMSGAILLAMAIPYTAHLKGHIMVSVLVERFSPRVRAIVDIAVSTLSLVFTFLLARELFAFAARMSARGYTTGYLQLPVAPSIYLVGIGFAMLALVLFRDIAQAAALAAKGSDSV